MSVTTKTTTEDIAAIRLLDEPVRRQLYEWVVAQARPVGRDESARALGIGRPLATFHLDRLAAAGVLNAGYQRLNEKTGPGAGRPARVYWRPEREFAVSLPERHYERMADVLATALERADAAGGVQEAAREAGAEIASGAPDLFTALQEGGYEPVTDGDGTIRLRNCPFHALVEEHQQLVCSANLAMAEGITEASGAESDLAPMLDPQPGYCCVAFMRDH